MTERANLQSKKVQRLRVLLKLMLAVSFAAIVYVSFSTGFSGAGKPRSLPTLRVDLGGISAGEAKQLLWENRPVIILHRSLEQIESLESLAPMLHDSGSSASVQPAAAENHLRSLAPEWFVALASGTDLGCSLNYIPGVVRVGAATLEGAFRDTCQGSTYDLAGRVLAGQQAKRNLLVPDYQIVDGQLMLGAD